MAAEWICDGCGKRAPADMSAPPRQFLKPRYWYERSGGDGIQTACSRECIDKVATQSGKTRMVLPI